MSFFIEHYLQKEILRRLSRHPGQNFTELMPQGVAHGQFGYHLKSLINSELVEKKQDGYRLSAKGYQYVSLVSRTNLDLLPHPKLFTLILIENDQKEFVMHRRAAEPFLGYYTFPGGALFFGETLEALNRRQLLEKVGTEVALTHRGVADLRHTLGGELVSHSYAQLFYGRVVGRPPVHAKDERFKPEWIAVNSLDERMLMPDIPALLSRLASEDNFFFLKLSMQTQFQRQIER